MKRFVLATAIFFTCILCTHNLLAQNNSDPQIVTSNSTTVGKLTNDGNYLINLHVGGVLPVLYGIDVGMDTILNVQFPYDILYIEGTFSETLFDVSKGYFSDKILINWTILQNAEDINQIKVYRRLFDDANVDDITGYVQIATLPSDSFQFEDTNVQGGTLYEYKVEAAGVSVIPARYLTYITGIGYRNPTGVVTGNVSFDGGSPVQDVVVRADPQGGVSVFGSSLLFDGSQVLKTPIRNDGLVDSDVSLQAWIRVDDPGTFRLFRLSEIDPTPSLIQNIDVDVTLTATDLLVETDYLGSNFTLQLSDFYPSGSVDGRGFDVLKPIASLSTEFFHLSVVLKDGNSPEYYVNGRLMDANYTSTLDPGLQPGELPTISQTGTLLFSKFPINDLEVGSGLIGHVDEVRAWSKDLDDVQIRTDFKRYLGGGETNLISYMRCDENAGDFAYDISKVGFDFNRNHGEIISSDPAWSDVKPTSSQLGILGVTDANGNYIISAIPYTGTGESYTLTPLFGVHEFEPAQQLVFIGAGSEIINKIDFKDVSSFTFLGKVMYTTQGVFDPIDEVANVTPGSVNEGDYNEYTAIVDGNIQSLSKGEYFYDDQADILYETPKVFVEGASVYIDGEIVLDDDNLPVTTGPDGSFEIQVPIGNHYIEVRKDKHHLVHGGRFPAAEEGGDDLFEFFENQVSQITFLDTTRVTLVGRIVGGTREADKPIGFGSAGLLEEVYNAGTPEETTVAISSINNIGEAAITLNYLPFGATPGIGELETSFNTNIESGEYRVDLIPLDYTINQTGGLSIINNTEINLLEANELLNLSQVNDADSSQYLNPEEATVYSPPYHSVKSFTYRSIPVLNVVSQSSDLEVLSKGVDADSVVVEEAISTEGFLYPVYTQGLFYAVVFETFEEYINQDAGAGNEVFDYVPIVDGDFIITNNLSVDGTENVTVDDEYPSISAYTFQAGLPSISAPFTRTIDIQYRVDGVDYEALNYEREGIILGGQSDGSQTFVTKAPDTPDIILRDPPGSKSSASIQEGETFTLSVGGSSSLKQSVALNTELKLGVKFEAGGGLAGPVIKSDHVNSAEAGIGLTVSSSEGNSVTKTYSFTKTISTSSDPKFVGSDGDLYIGNSSNYIYGSFDNVRGYENPPAEGDTFELINDDGESVFISKQTGYFFSEEPTETFFIFSQKHVVGTLIPELEGILSDIENGILEEDTATFVTKTFYEEQIRQWRSVIQENERMKYRALYERDELKDELTEALENDEVIINKQLNTITAIGAGITAGTSGVALLSIIGGAPGGAALLLALPVGIQTISEATAILEDKRDAINQRIDEIEENFEQNVSFDAGVGSFTSSSNSVVTNTASRNIKFDLDASFQLKTGFLFQGAGIIVKTKNQINASTSASVATKETTSTKISYTLKDNDKDNFLSVDVINAYDGFGPIFSTVGGQTSCPYEDSQVSLFYNNSDFEADSLTIYSGGELLSFATQRVEDPLISVEKASLSDVPETRAAEFTLILENNSASETDGSFLLQVDNTTNPNNAIFNLGVNGTIVSVPYGETVEFALTLEKSISDIYEYEDIDIILKSTCDSKASDRVTVSAVFRPSCTSVELDNPLENWVFNAGDAFNADNTTNPLSIGLFSYDQDYTGFEKFRLEYRPSTASSWTRLRSYYNSQDLLDETLAQGETNAELITGPESNFSWDLGALGVADGPYELRAISQCANGTEYISDIVSGTIDFDVPVQFGTPTPTDGILGAGEDLLVKFSEDVLFNSAISKIEIKGESNQQEVNHNVSVRFEGSGNVMTLPNPSVTNGDFSIEFWMMNETIGDATIFSQTDGLSLVISGTELIWTFGGQVLAVDYFVDNLFHHYALTYNSGSERMSIYLDDIELGALEGTGNLIVSNIDNAIVIGGNSFVGNIHDLRFWSKWISLSESNANKSRSYVGAERDLVGYWPMDEGFGDITNDLARFRNGQLTTDWDIKPKGSAFSFANNSYLELDDVDFVQLTDEMDITLSFWIKTESSEVETLFSNGRGNTDDLVQSNGRRNKWAINIENGLLHLNSEGFTHQLTSSDLSDNKWHQITLILRRIGSLRTYVDGVLETSNAVSEIGGLSGNKFWIGARGFLGSDLVEVEDQFYTGKIDEIRLWNTARSFEQISRDRYNEVDFDEIGLMMYCRFNETESLDGMSPQYFHAAANETVLPSNAVIVGGGLSFNNDAPPIKLQREYLSFPVSHIINGDEMILTPSIADWSILENQILDITVDRMFDIHGNRQSSPITWTAFVRRNEVEWFAEDGSQQIDIEKLGDESLEFEITILNKGGQQQPFSIENIPSWMTVSDQSGTLAPNSSSKVIFEVDPDLTTGIYSLDLYLDTDFNFDEKLLVNLRVLESPPDWVIDPADFEFSMNLIALVEINGSISSDELDRVAAFVGPEVRGFTELQYNEAYDLYFSFLNIYSNVSTGEDVELKVWDSSSGIIYSDVTPKLTFISNEIHGTFAEPIVLQVGSTIEQEITLDEGWNWISFGVDFGQNTSLDEFFSGYPLVDGDHIKQINEFAQFSSNFGWSGSLTEIDPTLAYKFRISNAFTLRTQGQPIDLSTYSVNLNEGWNWLSYPGNRKIPVEIALGLFDASVNDVIKDQESFAIYDNLLGWVGSLTHLRPGDGYMIRSLAGGELRYQDFGQTSRVKGVKEQEKLHRSVSQNTMSVVGALENEEYIEGDILIARSGDLIIGKSSWTSLEDGRIRYFISLDQSVGRISFALQRDRSEYDLQVEAAMTPAESVHGTLEKPILLKKSEFSETSQISIAPNPNSGSFDFEIEYVTSLKQGQGQGQGQIDDEVLVQLIDLNGRVLWKQKLKSEALLKGRVDVNVDAGLYSLVVFRGNSTETKLVVIR